MVRRSNTSHGGDDAGFTTAAFATLVFGFALIAAAGVTVASQELRSARRDMRADQETYTMDGIANAAAVRLLAEDGTPTLRWSEASEFGPLVITLESEGLKIAPAEMQRSDNVALMAQMLGRPDAIRIAAEVSNLQPSADGALRRSQIVEIDPSTRWRECATTLVSIYSRLSAFVLPPPSEPQGGGEDRHAGELWRVSVDASDGAWLDQIVRMTGSSGDPAVIVDELSGRSAGNHRTSCLTDIERLSGQAT